MFRVTTEIIDAEFQGEMPDITCTCSKEKTENMVHDSWSGARREVLSSYSKPRGRGRGHRSLSKVETHLPGPREL